MLVMGLIFVLYLYDGGMFFSSLRLSKCESLAREGQWVHAEGRVYRKEEKEKSWVLFIKDVRLDHNKVAREKLLIYLPKEGSQNVPKLGQRIRAEGAIEYFTSAPNPGNFNQKLYYKKQNIQGEMKEAVHVEAKGRPFYIREGLFSLRRDLAFILVHFLGQEKGGMLSSMILGEDYYADPDIKEIYQKSGIAHLLAISGLHVSFFGMGLYQLLRKAKVPLKLTVGISSLLLGLYVCMTGASVSALRAFIMFELRMGAILAGRDYDGLNSLSIAALLVMIKNPLAVTEAGFLLSFGAVFGLYAVLPVWEDQDDKKKRRDVWKPALSVQAVILPCMLYHYYEISAYSLLWNLIVIPLSAPLLGSAVAVAGLGYLALKGLFPKILVMGIGKIAAGILLLYERGSMLLLDLPGARLVTGQPSLWQIGGYYLILWIVLRMWKLQSRKWKEKLLFAGLLFAILLFRPPSYGKTEVYMLDIGQGDCFFVKGPSGQTHLIDGGSSTVPEVGRFRVEPFLKWKGVDTLDYVWISHGDMDHCNAVEEMLHRKKVGIRIKTLVLPPRCYWNEMLDELYRLAVEKKVKVAIMKQGDQYREGNMSFTCLWPPKEDPAIEGNEASMVLSMKHGEFDMLFTGDLERNAELTVAGHIRELQRKGELPDRYEVLKVGHHGSKFSSSDEFLKVTDPKEAMISSGRKNRYGHPHEEVLERLAKREIRIYNTKDRHAVKLYTDGKKYCILRP